MPEIAYIARSFSAAHMAVIEQARAIARALRAQGFDLTLRQLYYQFVARGLIPNKDTEYKRLGSILNDARLAGEFDWLYIVDRTRTVRGGDGAMEEPIEVIEPNAFAMALWQGQRHRVEVWVEKDALVGVIGQAADSLRVPFFSCRGYTSASEVWSAAQRIEGYLDLDDVEAVTILHLGDHDPSGIDMTRDITDRLNLFLDGDGYDPGRLSIHRIALNMEQVRRYNPPPNPAKFTDSRASGYVRLYGTESWELDALDPATLSALIVSNLAPLIDADVMEARQAEEERGRTTLRAISENYSSVIDYLDREGLLG